jgi:hypothetical protein
VFHLVENFSWEVNRSERALQAQLLVPLLEQPDGREWFLTAIKGPCSAEEGRSAEVFHLCFPLRDLFTEDLHRCREIPESADEFIAYYNELFGLPTGFGVKDVWRTAPAGQVRHPGARGRAGWHEDFLKERIRDRDLREKARAVRQMLGTEADVFIQTRRHVVIVECKYLSQFSREQYQRQQKTGKALARRVGKSFHFGLVRERDADPAFVKIDEPYVTWDQVEEKLATI